MNSDFEQILEVVKQRLVALESLWVQSVSPVYADTGRREPEFVGSAVLLQVGPAYFAVTAAHVLLKSEEFPLYLGGASQIIDFQGRYLTSTPPGESTADDTFDLAIMPLSGAQVLRLGNCRYVQVHEMNPAEQVDYTAVPDSCYMVLGYPATKQRRTNDNLLLPVHMAAVVEPSKSTAYVREQLDPSYHLVLAYNKREMVRDWVPATAPDPFGLSGGGVWRLNGLFGEAPLSAHLVAIPIEYTGKQWKEILCTRIGHVVDAIHDFFPQLRNYLPHPPA
jgi:hypothetical protein